MKKVKQKFTTHQQTKRIHNRGTARALRTERGWRHFCATHLPQVVVACVSTGILLIAFIGAHLPAFANATLPARASTHVFPHPSTTGGLLRFNDPNEGTALSVQTNPDDVNAGVFTFTSPKGVQYHGGNESDLFFTGNGLIELLFPGNSSIGFGPVQTFIGTTQTGVANVSLRGTIDTVNNRAGKVILTDFSSHQQFFLNSSGGPPDEMTAVTTYDTAATGPTPMLFNLTSRLVTAGYTESAFNEIMQSQVQKVGAITKIVPETPSQQMTDPAGITYFTVIEQVTHTKNNGATRTDKVIAVFILEDRQWKFWFSHSV